MTSVWDDPDLRSGGEFVKLDNKGDKIGGKILAVRAHRFDDNSVAPQIIFTDKIQGTGEEKTWTAGQIQAKRKLAELRPEAGDDFVAELTDIEKRGTKTLKHIDIQVWRGGRKLSPPTETGPGIPGLNNHASSPVLNRPAAAGKSAFDDEPPF
jgi:hypothetical protein